MASSFRWGVHIAAMAVRSLGSPAIDRRDERSTAVFGVYCGEGGWFF